jgi:SAM-dependent methyltransferase
MPFDSQDASGSRRGTMNDAAIESMPLYTNLDRIAKGLAALGIGPSDPIPPEQLFHLDQWHYHDVEAIRTAAEQLGLGRASQVLDIGSGIGGPARYLAYTMGCHVTALELQASLHTIAVDLTRRCNLGERVTHLCGDALTYPIPEEAFDAVVSCPASSSLMASAQVCAWPRAIPDFRFS